MKPSRRKLLAALLCAQPFILIGDMDQAYAHLFRGGISVSTGAGLITTLTLRTAGSPETPMWSKCFGQAFTDSDITGCPLVGGNPTYPTFTIGGGTVPYSMSVTPTYWPSGRLKHAAFILLLGAHYTVASGSPVTVNINQSGNTSLPSASGRTLGNTATAALTAQATVMDGANPGSFTADLTTGISTAYPDNIKWIDGAAGTGWRIRCDYKAAGVWHGMLTGYNYNFVGNDASGNFGGIRSLWCTAAPFGDVTLSLRSWYSFSALGIFTGASQIRDNVVSGRTGSGTASWASGGTMTSAGNTLEFGQLVRLTGSPPTGLNTSTSYYISGTNTSTLQYNPPYASFQLNAAALTGTAIVPTGSPASFGFQTYPWMSCYSRVFHAGTTGEFDYIQGGGSVAPGISTYVDTGVQVVHDRDYMRKTLVIPAYDYTPVVSSNPAYSFYINTRESFYQNFDQTGIGDQIGILPAQTVRFIYTNALIDETMTRAAGLSSGQMTQCVRILGSPNFGTFPAWNRGTGGSATPYTGMGTLLYNQRYAGASTSSFDTIFSIANVTSRTAFMNGGLGPGETSHKPSFAYLPYVYFGEPQYLDMLMETTNMGISAQITSGTPTSRMDVTQYAPTGTSALDGSAAGSRNVKGPDNVTRYGMVLFSGQARLSAWAFRDIVYTAGIVPQNYAECPAYRQYFNDLANDNIDFAIAVKNKLASYNSYADNVGLLFIQAGTGIMDMWQTNGYLLSALAMDYGLRQYSPTLTIMNQLTKFVGHVVNTWGGRNLRYGDNLVTSDYSPGGAENGPMITSDTQCNFTTDNATVTWLTGSPNLQYTAASLYFPAVNDIWTFNPLGPSISSQPAPGAFPTFANFYVVGASNVGSLYTVQLSSTLGGSPINNTDSSSVAFTGYIDDGSGTGTPGNILTVTAISSGSVLPTNSTTAFINQMAVTGSGASGGIYTQISGSTGGVGTYNLTSQNTTTPKSNQSIGTAASPVSFTAKIAGILVGINNVTPINTDVGPSVTGFPTVIYHSALLAVSRGATLDATADSTLGSVTCPPVTTGNFGSSPQYCFNRVA